MKIADHPKFHTKWEDLQKRLGTLLSLAHEDPWVMVQGNYNRAIDNVKQAVELLRDKKLDK